jgi:hypothetical protein
MGSEFFICHSCNTKSEFQLGQTIGKNEECSKCRSDIRVCLNCEFYDKSKYNECREPISEAVREKSKRNSCESFKLKKATAHQQTVQDSCARMLEQAEALFKKKN